MQHLDDSEIAALQRNPPLGARVFFIGDHLGGSGWEVELPDGSTGNYYVQLPESMRITPVDESMRITPVDVRRAPRCSRVFSAPASGRWPAPRVTPAYIPFRPITCGTVRSTILTSPHSDQLAMYR